MPLILAYLLLGLAAWIVTSIIVEAEIFRDVREWVTRSYARSPKNSKRKWLWYKARYLIGCHLCTGCWVCLAMAFFITPLVSTPVVGWFLSGMALKGIAHLALIAQHMAETWMKGAST